MRSSVVVLALCMLFTGTINTIATKYQDIIVIGTAPDGTPLTFRHPAVQSACMFLGESLCLVPYFIMRWRRRRAKRLDPAYVPMPAHEKRSRRIGRIMAFAVPTLCDATGTSLMNIGLFYTYASTYQMLRGTLVLFAGSFTVLILRRRLFIHHWLGMVLITAGAALVGASSVLYPNPSTGPSNLTLMPHHQQQQLLGSGWHVGSAVGVVGAVVNGTLGSGSGLHYDPGVSRVASRGMLGLAGLPGVGTAAAGVGSAPSGSSGGSSGSIGDVLVGPFGGGVRHGGVSGLHVWSAALAEGPDVAAAPLFGDLLVVGAQMFTALQFILEEKFLVKYKVPALLAVGLEGCWGLVLCAVLLPLTTLIRGPDGVPLDDAPAAFRAILSNVELGGAVYLSILSIAFFNFFGVSVTKSLSGAARATIDACRTLFIWLYALHAGWESFHALEVVGFVVLLSGTSLYNEIIKTCLPGTAVDGRQSQLPRHSHSRRARPSSAAGGTAGDDSDTLTTPLLTGREDRTAAIPGPGPAAGTAEAAAAAGGPVAAPGRGWRAPPVPLMRPAPAHSRAAMDAAQSAGGSGSWAYHMARSMRLGIHTLSPQSLAAAGGLASGDDGEDGATEGGSDGEGDDSVSESGSSFYSSCLGTSLGKSADGGLAGGLSSSLTGPSSRGGGRSAGGGGGAQRVSFDGAVGGSGGGAVRVLRGFEGSSGEALPGGRSSGSQRRGPAGAGGQAGSSGVGGLTASLAQAAVGGAATAAGGGGGSGGSRLRAASPGLGMPPLPHSSSSGSLRRQSSSGSVRGQQQQQ